MAFIVVVSDVPLPRIELPSTCKSPVICAELVVVLPSTRRSPAMTDNPDTVSVSVNVTDPNTVSASVTYRSVTDISSDTVAFPYTVNTVVIGSFVSPTTIPSCACITPFACSAAWVVNSP